MVSQTRSVARMVWVLWETHSGLGWKFNIETPIWGEHLCAAWNARTHEYICIYFSARAHVVTSCSPLVKEYIYAFIGPSCGFLHTL